MSNRDTEEHKCESTTEGECLRDMSGESTARCFCRCIPCTEERVRVHSRLSAHTKTDGSWWENDGRGIPLFRVCDDCAEARLATVPERVKNWYSQADCDDQIEEEA